MITDDWKIQIVEQPGRFGKTVFIYRKTLNGAEVYNPMTQIVEPIDDGSVKQGLYLPDEMAQVLFDALQSNGYKPKAQSFIEGKNEAQGEHLKDLRKLLKL